MGLFGPTKFNFRNQIQNILPWSFFAAEFRLRARWKFCAVPAVHKLQISPTFIQPRFWQQAKTLLELNVFDLFTIQWEDVIITSSAFAAFCFSFFLSFIFILRDYRQGIHKIIRNVAKFFTYIFMVEPTYRKHITKQQMLW